MNNMYNSFNDIVKQIMQNKSKSLISVNNKSFLIDKDIADEFWIKIKKLADEKTGGNTSKMMNEIIKDWLVQPDFIVEAKDV